MEDRLVTEDDEREGRAEWEGPPGEPFEVLIERVGSDQEVRVSEHEGDEQESPLPPDTTVFGEPYGIAGRPPPGVEYVAASTVAGHDWLLAANVDRPAVTSEGDTVFFDMYKNGDTWEVGSKIEMAGDVTLDPRTGKKVITTKATYIGSASATEAMLKGSTVHSNLDQFLSSWLSHLSTLKSATSLTEIQDYCDDVTLAIGTLQTAIDNGWESTKHKIDA